MANSPLGDGLYVLRGPRRVGKSVVLKHLARALCGRQDVSPWQLLYVPADGMTDRDIRRFVALGRELTRPAGDLPRVWLVDEVTSIAGWTSAVKYLRDNTAFGRDTVVLTGSSSSGAAQAVRDLGAGRTGQAVSPFRMLLPMSFRDFLAVTSADLPRPDLRGAWELQSPSSRAAIEQCEPFVEELDLAWQRYLECGGFPRAVAEHERHGRVSVQFLEDLAAWLRADVDPDGPQDSVPVLLAELQIRSTSAFNIRQAGEALGIGRTSLETRLHRLVSTFAALWCPHRGEDGRRISGSQPKLYLTDPILDWLPSLLRPNFQPPDATKTTEAAVGLALARAIDASTPGRWADGDTIGYLRTEKNEVDFAPIPLSVPGGAVTTTPIEVKWVTSGWRSEALVIENKYRGGIVATKNITDFRFPVWAVPAPVVALLLT